MKRARIENGDSSNSNNSNSHSHSHSNREEDFIDPCSLVEENFEGISALQSWHHFIYNFIVADSVVLFTRKNFLRTLYQYAQHSQKTQHTQLQTQNRRTTATIIKQEKESKDKILLSLMAQMSNQIQQNQTQPTESVQQQYLHKMKYKY